jgi:glycosyltransferase involved in cell wall biosynthesis
MKVVFAITSFNHGGTELRLLDVLRGLDRTQFETILFTAKGGDLADEVSDSRIVIGAQRGETRLRGLWALWTLLRRERPDAIWCLQSSAVSFAGRLCAWLLGIPTVISIHGRYEGRAIMDWPNRLLTRLAKSRVVVVSKLYREGLVDEGIPERLITVQYNGVDTGRFSPPEDRDTCKQSLLGLNVSRPIIGTVGNLLPIKGHEVLLETAARVIGQCPEALFVIIGEGKRRAELERLSQTLCLTNHVRFLGTRNDVPDVMRTFDLFVLTSHSEGCPNVILEAMASGLPVVSTNVGGVPELVNADSGLLIPARDDATLAEVILRLLDDPARRQAMGEAGRRRAVAQFSLAQMIRAREELLQALVLYNRRGRREGQT